VASLYDAPGLYYTKQTGSIIQAVWLFSATLMTSVSAGGQTAECPTVQWEAYEFWSNGKATGAVSVGSAW